MIGLIALYLAVFVGSFVGLLNYYDNAPIYGCVIMGVLLGWVAASQVFAIAWLLS